jgi:hypothetical protein
MVIEGSENMLPLELRSEISSSEKLKVEFKESYAEATEIRYTMIAFANAIGGHIYVGVKETSTDAGIHIGEIIGLARPTISEASSNVRQWAAGLRPRINASFNSYKHNSNRIDVINVEESTQKPVCSDSGVYKIRTSDGNTGINPSMLREMIVGYNSFKSALLLECNEKLTLIKAIFAAATENPPSTNLNELSYSTIDAILSNGSLSSFFKINELIEIRRQAVQLNKLLHFTISAGGVVIPRKTFDDLIVDTCPKIKKRLEELISSLK